MYIYVKRVLKYYVENKAVSIMYLCDSRGFQFIIIESQLTQANDIHIRTV